MPGSSEAPVWTFARGKLEGNGKLKRAKIFQEIYELNFLAGKIASEELRRRIFAKQLISVTIVGTSAA
jgi:hypothetical protein